MLPSAMIVDIDGTVALRGERDPYDWESVLQDEPNPAVIYVVQCLQAWGMHTIFTTGRMEQCREDTLLWLQRNNLVGDHWATGAIASFDLLMRPDGDMRPDEVLKSELYVQRIAPFYRVRVVFDDRDKVVKMWRREHGLVVMQVAEGAF